MTRRDFIQELPVGIVAGTASAAALALLAVSQKPRPPRGSRELEPTVLRPPGALAESSFLSLCIRCQRCKNSCPTGAIQLATTGDPYALGTPFISAPDTACNLCLDCTRTCPTEALRPMATKEDVQMGLAIVDERTCVSFNGTGVCGACHTVCPLRNKAITQGLRNTPVVHAEYCVGCGLCEEACIIDGIKAIRVFSGRIS